MIEYKIDIDNAAEYTNPDQELIDSLPLEHIMKYTGKSGGIVLRTAQYGEFRIGDKYFNKKGNVSGVIKYFWTNAVTNDVCYCSMTDTHSPVIGAVKIS